MKATLFPECLRIAREWYRASPGNTLLRNISKAMTSACLVLALAAPAPGQNRELGCHFGLGLADFNGCPVFGLAAAFPLSSPVWLEAESFYYFNPADRVENPPAGFHQSSMAADLSLGFYYRFAEKDARLIPYAGAGIGYLYTSVLTDYSPSLRTVESRSRILASLAAGVRLRLSRSLGLRLEARWLVLSAGGGRVLRTSAGLYTFF
jgi:hypothetical protein